MPLPTSGLPMPLTFPTCPVPLEIFVDMPKAGSGPMSNKQTKLYHPDAYGKITLKQILEK